MRYSPTLRLSQIAVLNAGFLLGTVLACSEAPDTREYFEEGEEVAGGSEIGGVASVPDRAGPIEVLGDTLRIFADRDFYRERAEREQVFRGTLQRTPVRTGPNTRDMPFALIVGEERYAVYSGGIADSIFEPFVGAELEVVGKLIDQRAEGFGMEVWIATLARIP